MKNGSFTSAERRARSRDTDGFFGIRARGAAMTISGSQPGNPTIAAHIGSAECQFAKLTPDASGSGHYLYHPHHTVP